MADMVKLWLCPNLEESLLILTINGIDYGISTYPCCPDAIPYIAAPTADIRIVECGECGGMGLIPHRDQIGMPDTVPCPTCKGTGKVAQIPLTAEMLTEMAKGD